MSAETMSRIKLAKKVGCGRVWVAVGKPGEAKLAVNKHPAWVPKSVIRSRMASGGWLESEIWRSSDVGLFLIVVFSVFCHLLDTKFMISAL